MNRFNEVSRTCGLFFAAGMTLTAATDLAAQSQPQQSGAAKPIRIIVGFVPGGGTDVTARLLAQRLGVALGQQVVVENRAGAAGWIAAEAVAKAAPDGLTLLMVASATGASAATRNPPFNLEKDFAPVSLVTVAPLVLLVHPSLPARDVKELIAHAKSAPAPLAYGSDGIGSGSHLSGELFGFMAGLKLVHVPFKGGAESAVATASGQVQLNFPSVPSALPLLRSNKYNGLAVTTVRRSALLPTLPTLDELGMTGFDIGTWFGLLAPAGTPPEAIARLNAATVKVVAGEDLKDLIAKQGMDALAGTPEQFSVFLRSQMAMYRRVAKIANANVD